MRYERFQKSILLAFALFGGLHSFAGDSPKTDSNQVNVMALAWVLYPESYDVFIKGAREKMKTAICNPRGMFGVTEQNYVSVPQSIPLNDPNAKSFSSYVSSALAKMIDVNGTPTLVVAIKSHGDFGAVCRPGVDGPSIDHSALAKVLFDKIDETKKEVKLVILYDACYSYSLVDAIKKRAEDPNGKFTNGDRRYRYAVDLFASADQDKKAWHNLYWDVFEVIAKTNRNSMEAPGSCGDQPFDPRSLQLFCFLGAPNTQHYWSSYNPDWKKTLSTQNEESVLMLKTAPPFFERVDKETHLWIEQSNRVDIVQAWINQLDSKDWAEQWNAMMLLAHQGKLAAPATDKLKAIAKDPGARNRGQAIATLIQIGNTTPELESLIMAKLGDSDSHDGDLERLLELGDRKKSLLPETVGKLNGLILTETDIPNLITILKIAVLTKFPMSRSAYERLSQILNQKNKPLLEDKMTMARPLLDKVVVEK